MKNILICGHHGLVGSSIERSLRTNNINNIITINKKKLNLLDQNKVKNFLNKKNIDQIYICAAKVGGIYANNTYPANFIYENLMIQANLINSAFENNIKKILFLGSSCIYPKNINRPMLESDLLTGKLEETNEPYAIAKIAGIKLCESYNRQYGKSNGIDYRSIMPTNTYGPFDNYDLNNSHVISALFRKIHNAKIKNKKNITLWGTGKAKREFLYVDDLASAAIFIMNLSKKKYLKVVSSQQSHINVGSGEEVTIKKLAFKISNIVGFKGNVLFDYKNPDGPKRKFLNSNKILKLGWKPRYKLQYGLEKQYADFITKKII